MAFWAKSRAPAAAYSGPAAEASLQAAKLQELLITARRFAETMTQGERRQKRQGRGENFWQFRLYQPGEEAAHIDWRRSARDDNLYIREKERETAQMLCLIPDLSASMRYRSAAALRSKEERALLWCFTLAIAAAKQGELCAVPNLLPPVMDKAIGERLAEALAGNAAYPPLSGLNSDFTAAPRFAHCVIISDFLDNAEKLERALDILMENRVSVSLLAIADPAEINFPFSGDMIFSDPETGEKLHIGQAQKLRADYRMLYQAHQDRLKKLAERARAALMFDETGIMPEKQLPQLRSLLQHDSR